MRYALAVTPKNYLLFGCHFINFNSQLIQGYRWYDYWYGTSKPKWEKIRAEAKAKADEAAESAEGLADQAKDKVAGAADQVKSKVS